VNAMIRPLFALSALLLSACGTAAGDLSAQPRFYRDTLILSEAPTRSIGQSPTALSAHDRARAVHERATLTWNRWGH
jgi:hypothetical protein